MSAQDFNSYRKKGINPIALIVFICVLEIVESPGNFFLAYISWTTEGDNLTDKLGENIFFLVGKL